MNNKNLTRIIKLQIVKDLITGFGYYTEFILHETSYNVKLSYDEYSDLANNMSLLTNSIIKPEDLMKSDDEKSNELLDLYSNLNVSYKLLNDTYGLSKDQSELLFKKLDETLLRNPQYYVFIPSLCDLIQQYILNNISKQVLINNFVMYNLNGSKTVFNKKLFYKIFYMVLNEFDKYIK